MNSRLCQLLRWRIGWAAVALAALTLAPRLPLIGDPIDVSPDGCEYLGIARHLADEGRWLSSIKWHYFTDEPVVHFALGDRPPLFPLWAALWADGGPDASRIYRVRLANVLLAAAVVIAAFLLLLRWFPFFVSAGAALLFACYPAFVRNSAQPLTEPLFLLLMLGAFHAAVADRPRPFAAGALAGLAYVTRPAGLLILLVLAVEMLSKERQKAKGKRQKAKVKDDQDSSRSDTATFDFCPMPFDLCLSFSGWRALAWLTAGFALVCLPYWTALWLRYGSPFYSILSYNFSIGHIHEGMFYGFERRFPSPAEFVRENPARVARLVWEQTANLGVTLVRSLWYLWALALFLRWEDLRRHRLLLLFAALNFAFHAVSWTVWGAARYQFPGYLFLAPVLLEAPVRRLRNARPPWLGTAVAAIALTALLARCADTTVQLFREKFSPQAGVRLGWAYREAAAWVDAQPWPEPGLCAATSPAILNLLTRHPAITLPRFRDAAQARRFLERYHPGALVLTIDETVEEQAADVLLARPWSAHRVRPELAPWLEAALVRARPRPSPVRPGSRGGQLSPKQWLIILRVRI